MPADAPVRDPRTVAAVFAGGVAGALARVALGRALPQGTAAWPWGTLIANVVGAALLGHFATRLQERLPLSAYRRPLLGTGLCGALTTFSTLQVELFDMLDAGRPGRALLYAVASLGLGFAAVSLASAATRRVRTLA